MRAHTPRGLPQAGQLSAKEKAEAEKQAKLADADAKRQENIRAKEENRRAKEEANAGKPKAGGSKYSKKDVLELKKVFDEYDSACTHNPYHTPRLPRCQPASPRRGRGTHLVYSPRTQDTSHTRKVSIAGLPSLTLYFHRSLTRARPRIALTPSPLRPQPQSGCLTCVHADSMPYTCV